MYSLRLRFGPRGISALAGAAGLPHFSNEFGKPDSGRVVVHTVQALPVLPSTVVYDDGYGVAGTGPTGGIGKTGSSPWKLRTTNSPSLQVLRFLGGDASAPDFFKSPDSRMSTTEVSFRQNAWKHSANDEACNTPGEGDRCRQRVGQSHPLCFKPPMRFGRNAPGRRAEFFVIRGRLGRESYTLGCPGKPASLLATIRRRCRSCHPLGSRYGHSRELPPASLPQAAFFFISKTGVATDNNELHRTAGGCRRPVADRRAHGDSHCAIAMLP